MKLVIISLTMYFIMKLVYSYFGDYNSEYWAVSYYMINYFLKISLLLFVVKQTYTKLQRSLIWIGILYFGVLLLMNFACLLHIEWYVNLVSGVGKWGLSIAVLVLSIIFINYLRLRNYASKRGTMGE